MQGERDDLECAPLPLCASSAELDFYICVPETPAGVSGTPFHQRGRKDERQLPRLFPTETSTLGGYPFRLAALRQSTFPKGTALAVAGNFSAVPKGSPERDDFPRPGEDVTAGDKRGILASRSDD